MNSDILRLTGSYAILTVAGLCYTGWHKFIFVLKTLKVVLKTVKAVLKTVTAVLKTVMF